ncbi:MAG: substrate import-associated zinc metallohydrolase lipoprotein [Petrimonas sp.]|uniref:substrate import-associated zinc metallohydrolase lipoprotein n=1 Tax=Petrimonas sp. TaxID=2023866 RepID=UPI00095F18C5|nr:substrate import-associated zinc metallohydrolase lipoprotein [Petrimonas sp.]MEA4981017.1 substrate import-associated zinc metallohydrolase lipoprotein [Petrimonas sp.]MEA5046273.1 substrate import-associated zinc metallohydrolase lipoprotein [Petrimonas sp.]MEA5064038.1 substrate import-associated zinc metallohydrolase lipoprotein [Petrimonas sp.]OJV36793.1 MAG: hypothetical protein BGO33_04540 [Bacteroidia bacterium 43-41]
MKNIIYYVAVVVSLFFVSCSEEKLGESQIDTTPPQLNTTDVWIRENYTTPFNVEVKYKWDKSELDNTKKLTPPYQDRVIPFLDNMKKIWIDPYVKNGGINFMKQHIPKLMVMVGSHNYLDNGGIVLGQAEGGRKITLFDINYITFEFDGLSKWEKSKIVDNIIRAYRTMHHEFGHILTQTVAYPVEYKKITPRYVSNWIIYSDSDAKRLGFVTAYAMLNPDEDFSEMLSYMLTMGNEKWNKYIDDIVVYDENWDTDVKATATAKSSIRQKEKIIADYMLQAWKINLYQLQDDIEKAMIEMKILE